MIVIDSAAPLNDLLCKICPKSNIYYDLFVPNESEQVALEIFKTQGLATQVNTMMFDDDEYLGEKRIWVTTTKGSEMVLGWMCDE